MYPRICASSLDRAEPSPPGQHARPRRVKRVCALAFTQRTEGTTLNMKEGSGIAMEESKREVMAELDNEWHTLRLGNPVPGLYPQTGAEAIADAARERLE